MTDISTHPPIPAFSAARNALPPPLVSPQVASPWMPHAGGSAIGDSVHFSGSKKDKLKKRTGKIRRWVTRYALTLALIPVGAGTVTAAAIDGTSHTGTTVPIVRMTNPNNLGSPVLLKGPAAVSQKDVQSRPSDQQDTLKPGSDITAADTLTYAKAGQLSDIAQVKDDHYQVTVLNNGKKVTVNTTLNTDQFKEIQTLQAFGASQNDPLSDPLPTALPGANDFLSPSQLLGYARAGMLLGIKNDPIVSSGGGKGGSTSSDPNNYSFSLTDGKQLYDGTIDLTPQQFQLLQDNAKGKIAEYRGSETTGGGVSRLDILMILQGLGLAAGGIVAGVRKKKSKDKDPDPDSETPQLLHGGNSPYRARKNKRSADGEPELELAGATASVDGGDNADGAPDVAEGLEQLPGGFAYPSVTLNDMAGIARQTRQDIEEVMEVLTTDQETKDKLGIEPVKGVLLYGPPGTGKTMLAEVLAHETGRLYRCISASDLKTEKYKGTGIQAIRQEFATVKEAAKSGQPLLLQIDEIDSLFGDRGKSDDEDSQGLNKFLTEVDKLQKEAPNVVIVYTTNHYKKLDGAATRNGRVSYKIKVPRPSTKEQRLEILELYAQKPKPKALAEDVDLSIIAEKTQGFSPIDLRELMSKASVRALLKDRTVIMQDDLLEAVKVIDRQRKKDSSSLTSVERPTTTFDDLGGLDEIIPHFREIAQQFSRRAEGEFDPAIELDEDEENDLKPILLYGESGTGKTELGRAMANEAKCNFMYLNGAEFEDGVIGHGAAKVREVFEEARENGPTILFIDEADAAFRARGGINSNSEREATLNQLLTEMNGLSANDGVFVMAATNRPDIMDSAAKSRFESISIPKPTHPKQRRQIIDIMAKKRPVSKNVDRDALAEDTGGGGTDGGAYSGRDLKSLLQIANREKRKAGRTEITQEDIDNARDIFELGEKSAYPGTDAAVKLVGIHEIIGHGLTTMALKRRLPEVKVRAVTMEARRPQGGGGQVLGFVRPYFPDDITYTSIARYLCQLVIAAGGRASERVILGKEQKGAETAGGGSDYQQMENIVIHMLQSGMIPGFAPNHYAKSKQELTSEEKQVVDFLIGSAEQAAETLIETATHNNPHQMVQLVENGIAAKTVRNSDAEALFTDVLTESDWEPLYTEVDTYISTVIDQLKKNAQEKQQAFTKSEYDLVR